MKDEALRLALEALGHFEKAGLATLKTIDAITAIKQALEQPEPEPVAWRELLREARDNCKASIVEEGISASRKEYRIDLEARLTAALNTSPPKREWQGLTDEEMHECWDSPLTPLGMKHARMIEAKLKEKNT